ncbi:hypothetical protein N7526_005666 [Penicillium atrosanguineum]|nr:hypothetical protein N7526_005666 [Penicillium atrosanguineum]
MYQVDVKVLLDGPDNAAGFFRTGRFTLRRNLVLRCVARLHVLGDPLAPRDKRFDQKDMFQAGLILAQDE